jgi:hypothetical protein
MILVEYMKNKLLRVKHPSMEGSRSLRSLFSTNYDNGMKLLKFRSIQEKYWRRNQAEQISEQRNAIFNRRGYSKGNHWCPSGASVWRMK